MNFATFPAKFQSLLHGLDLIGRDVRVLGAVKAEHRRLDLACKVKGILRHGGARRIHQASIKGNARLEVGIMRCIKPDGPPAPAKADDPEPVSIAALRLRPSGGGVEIGETALGPACC